MNSIISLITVCLSIVLFLSCIQINDSADDNNSERKLINSLGKEYSITNLKKENTTYIFYVNDFHRNREAKFYLSQDKTHILDSLTFRNLLFEPIIISDNKFFLKIVLPIKAGMGHFVEKTVLLASLDETLLQSLNIITREEVEIGSDNEEYNTDLVIEGLNVEIQESFLVKKEGIIIDSFNIEYDLNYLDEKGIFYNNLSSEVIPSVDLGQYQYEYQINSKEWNIKYD